MTEEEPEEQVETSTVAVRMLTIYRLIWYYWLWPRQKLHLVFIFGEMFGMAHCCGCFLFDCCCCCCCFFLMEYVFVWFYEQCVLSCFRLFPFLLYFHCGGGCGMLFFVRYLFFVAPLKFKLAGYPASPPWKRTQTHLCILNTISYFLLLTDTEKWKNEEKEEEGKKGWRFRIEEKKILLILGACSWSIQNVLLEWVEKRPKKITFYTSVSETWINTFLLANIHHNETRKENLACVTRHATRSNKKTLQDGLRIPKSPFKSIL